MSQKEIQIHNVGSVEQYKKGGQTLHNVYHLAAVKSFDLGPFFTTENFTSIDPNFNEWFDTIAPDAPAVDIQQYSLQNYFVDDHHSQEGCPGPGKAGLSTLRYKLSQSEFVTFTQKHGIYAEVTLGHIANLLGYPKYYNLPLSDWSGSDTFLLRKKDGTLCWITFDISWGDGFCNMDPYDKIYMYDFEPDKGIPSNFIMFKASPELFDKVIDKE